MRSNQQEYNWLPTGQTMKQALVGVERNDPMDLVMKARLTFAGLVTALATDPIDPMDLAMKRMKQIRLIFADLVTASPTNPKEIKTVLEKETHDLIIPSKDHIIDKMLSTLPEEWQADLQALQKRWIKKEYSSFKVRRLTIKYLSDMYFAAVKVKTQKGASHLYTKYKYLCQKLGCSKAFKIG